MPFASAYEPIAIAAILFASELLPIAIATGSALVPLCPVAAAKPNDIPPSSKALALFEKGHGRTNMG